MAYDFRKTTVIPSGAYEGVRFTIRRLNVIQRARANAPILEKRARFAELIQQVEELAKDPAMVAQARAADEAAGAILNIDILPALIRAAFVSIEGFTVEGDAPTVDELLEYAPTDLLREIYAACVSESALSDADAKNLQSPTTLDAAVDGRVTPTTAMPAAESATTGAAPAA